MCRRANAVGAGKMLYLSPDNRIGRICPGYNRLEGWFFERRQRHKLTGWSPNSLAKAERANISRVDLPGACRVECALDEVPLSASSSLSATASALSDDV
jgi:hypothetical protein